MVTAIGVVWRELHRADGKRLVPAEGGDPDLLAATIGNLFRLHGPSAFSGEAPAPRVSDDKEADLYRRYTDMLNGADVQRGRLGDTQLALRAVLWEVENGAPAGPTALPQEAKWVLGPAATVAGDYKVEGDDKGPRYRLWVSQEAPLDAPYISSLTGTGVPATVESRPGLGRFLALVGLFGFVWLLLSLSYAGSTISDVYFLLKNDRPVRAERFVDKYRTSLCNLLTEMESPSPGEIAHRGITKGGAGEQSCAPEQVKAVAVEDVTAFFSVCLVQTAPSAAQSSGGAGAPTNVAAVKAPAAAPGAGAKAPADGAEGGAAGAGAGGAQGGAKDVDVKPGAVPAARAPATPPKASIENCRELLALVTTYSAHTVASDGDGFAWIAAVSDVVLGQLVPRGNLRSISIDMPLLGLMVSVALLIVGISYGVMGQGLGFLISPQNRLSLALAQATCWTILLLSSALGMAAFNSGLGAAGQVLAEHAATKSPNASASSSGFFPMLEPLLWSVLGITLSSSALSMVIKSVRGSVPADMGINVASDVTRTQNGIGVLNGALPVVARQSPADARISDLVMGEDAANLDKIDITRLQMVMITVGLLVAYGQNILATVRERSADSVFLAVSKGEALFSALPVVGQGMLVMLIVSHSTYLVSKSVTQAPAPAP